MDKFKHGLFNQMKDHCRAGLNLPKGEGPENLYVRKKALMAIVKKFSGPPEFDDQKKEFALHVHEFEIHYKLSDYKEKRHA